MSLCFLHYGTMARCLRFLQVGACAFFVVRPAQALPEQLSIGVIKLPALQINGEAARAHTQGLDIISSNYYVTARRDDVPPKRALLLRTRADRSDWDVWDLTPIDNQANMTALDHPGGLQSDGERLWIPLAESKRQGRSLVRCFSIARLVPGQPAQAEFEFPVQDHIGALAVSAKHEIVLGASWDTETVYQWDFAGRLHRTLGSTELSIRGLGVASGRNQSGPSSGLAVQDWKFASDRLFASGLRPRGAANLPRSQLLAFDGFSESAFRSSATLLPRQGEIELGQEAMAISEGSVYFLPEDLAATNRIFRASLADLFSKKAAP